MRFKRRALTLILTAAMIISMSLFAAGSAGGAGGASRSKQTVIFNSSEVFPEAYNIGGNNYVKLRDIAYLLKDTSSRFSVSFDVSANAVYTEKGKDYEPVGGEMSPPAETLPDSCVKSRWSLYVDGKSAQCEIYNIAGNNYFKLRELGTALGFVVYYDAENNAAVFESAEFACPGVERREAAPEKTKISAADEQEFVSGISGALALCAKEIEVTIPEGYTEQYLIMLRDYLPVFSQIDGYAVSYYADGDTLFLKPEYTDAALVWAFLSGARAELSPELEPLLCAARRAVNSARGNTQAETARALHDLLAETVEYDFSDSDEAHTAYGALVRHAAVCDGYSNAYALLCRMKGIGCVRIAGTATNDGETSEHAWNRIYVNGAWQSVDVTWDDPVIIGGGSTVDHAYFMPGEDVFAQSHSWLRSPLLEYTM